MPRPRGRLARRQATRRAARSLELERYVTLIKEEGAAHGESLVDYDSAFHVAIAQATGNQTLVALVRALNETLRESRSLSFRPEAAPSHAISDHVAILSAIREKDPAAATDAMRHPPRPGREPDPRTRCGRPRSSGPAPDRFACVTGPRSVARTET